MILSVIAIYYVSDCIREYTTVDAGAFNFYGVIWFFRLLLILVVLSLGIFFYEAYTFNKQKRIKERNESLILIFLILLLGIVFGGYFLQFVI